MKKVSLLMGIALTLFPLGLGVNTVNAAEVEDIVIEDVVETDAPDVETPVEGVFEELAPVEPIEGSRLTRGTKIPTQRHNVSKGRYNFGGSAYNQVIYTNKLFYGVRKYKISITNRGPQTVNAQFKTTKSTAKSMNVASKKNVSATVSVSNANTNYYLRFSGKHYDVSGWVSK